MPEKKADVFLYQERMPLPDKKALPYATRFGTQVVLDDVLLAESYFMWSGTLLLDREKARDYGGAVGKLLHERGIRAYDFHQNQKYHNEPCMSARDSDVRALSEAFEEAVKKNL